MELKCPQCGKWMAVSQEELVIHDCQVVCPQCLAVCTYEGGALTVRDDSDAPYRHTAPAAETQTKTQAKTQTEAQEPQEASRFCHSCGKQLPAGISFCPYCGADLKAPFDEKPAPKSEATPKPEPAHTASAPKPAAQEKPRHTRENVQHEASPRQQQTTHVEDKLRTVSRQYNGVHTRHQHSDDRPSTLFKAVAYTIIIALIILLVYIIIAGSNIEPNL